MKLGWAAFGAAGLLGLGSLLETRLSVFALLALVIALAAWTRVRHPRRRWLLAYLCVSLLCCCFALYRFILREAMPGIIEAHGRADSAHAVSLLREILFAQDAARRYAWLDPDADGVGSAALLHELSGGITRTGKKLSSPPLASRFTPRVGTASGPAARDSGYLYLVCVPRQGGGYTARASDELDAEAAERHWVAYAWPSSGDLPHSAAYFIDEHENIWETPNQSGSGLRLVGAGAPPTCQDALVEPSRSEYRPWRGKKARTELPGAVDPGKSP